MTQRLGRWDIVLLPRRSFAFWAGSDCEWWILLPLSINQQRGIYFYILSVQYRCASCLPRKEKKVPDPYEHYYNILNFFLHYPFSSCSYSLLVSVIMSLTLPSDKALSLNLFQKEEYLLPLQKKKKSTSLICLYYFCLFLINLFTHYFPSNSSDRPLFPRFISALMDIVSTGRLLI